MNKNQLYQNRISLSNGCSMSTPSIHRANWNQQGASLKSDWYIHDRFYDPSVKLGEKHSNGKQCIVKGMNEFKNLADRRQITKDLLANEMNLLQVRGHNPIAKMFSIQMQEVDISNNSDLLSFDRQSVFRRTPKKADEIYWEIRISEKTCRCLSF